MFRFTAVAIAALALSSGIALGASDVSVPASSGLGTDLIVNGQPISQNHVQLMLTSINPNPNARGAGGEDARTAARQELVTQELLAQAAKKQGLDKEPTVADQLAFEQRAILSRAYLQNYFEKNPVTETSLKAGYDWNKANGKIVEYKVRQILLNTPGEAQDAIDKLAKGEDFTALAKRLSQDPGAQNSGGDLGWFRPDIFVDHHFTDAIVSLKKGEYTKAPVRTRFGWHVIKVEDGPRPVANAEDYDALDDSVKDALRQKTVQIRIEELTADLGSKAKITGPGATNLARAAK